MNIDLTKATNALSGLKSPPSAKALDELWGHLSEFRSKIGKDLNEAEFRYVMQTLFNEQVVTVPATDPRATAKATVLAHGFSIRAVI